MKKLFYFILIAAVAGVVYATLVKQPEPAAENPDISQTEDEVSQDSSPEINTDTEAKEESSLDTVPKQEAETNTTQNAATEVKFNGQGFTPATVTIKKGGTVKWTNESGGSFWPASAVHPTHDAYPVSGGCIASAFDACEVLPAGSDFSFKFDVAGEWGYHDHLNPEARGKIIVQ